MVDLVAYSVFGAQAQIRLLKLSFLFCLHQEDLLKQVLITESLKPGFT